MPRIHFAAGSALGLVLTLLGGACHPALDPPQTHRAATPVATPSTPAPRPSASQRPSFHARISPAPGDRMSASWHDGCPVGLEDLRLLTLSFWGYDGRAHTGELVMNVDVSKDVIRVFERLFEARFPIRRMRLVDEYGAVDDRSMTANNTSGFNCRWRAGSPGVWSEHAYGRAIDLNPLVNPYVTSSGFVDPAAGRPYADRSRHDKGMIHSGDIAVRAFASIGWGWGGSWSDPTDYQHFSATGR